MIAEEELIDHVLTVGEVVGAVAVTAKALFAHSAVEALDEGLLVLLVGPGNAMSTAVGGSPLGYETDPPVFLTVTARVRLRRSPQRSPSLM